jgi:hypothetical protein
MKFQFFFHKFALGFSLTILAHQVDAGVYNSGTLWNKTELKTCFLEAKNFANIDTKDWKVAWVPGSTGFNNIDSVSEEYFPPISNQHKNEIKNAVMASFKPELTIIHFSGWADCRLEDFTENLVDVVIYNGSVPLGVSYAAATVGFPGSTVYNLFIDQNEFNINSIALGNTQETSHLNIRGVVHEFGHVAGLEHDAPSVKTTPDGQHVINVCIESLIGNDNVCGVYGDTLNEILKSYTLEVSGSSYRFNVATGKIESEKKIQEELLFVKSDAGQYEYFRDLTDDLTDENHNYIQNHRTFYLRYNLIFRLNAGLVSAFDANKINFLINQNQENPQNFSKFVGDTFDVFSTMSYGWLAMQNAKDFFDFCKQPNYSKLKLCQEKYLNTIRSDYNDQIMGYFHPSDINTLQKAYADLATSKLISVDDSNFVSSPEFFEAVDEFVKKVSEIAVKP